MLLRLLFFSVTATTVSAKLNDPQQAQRQLVVSYDKCVGRVDTTGCPLSFDVYGFDSALTDLGTATCTCTDCGSGQIGVGDSITCDTDTDLSTMCPNGVDLDGDNVCTITSSTTLDCGSTCKDDTTCTVDCTGTGECPGDGNKVCVVTDASGVETTITIPCPPECTDPQIGNEAYTITASAEISCSNASFEDFIGECRIASSNPLTAECPSTCRDPPMTKCVVQCTGSADDCALRAKPGACSIISSDSEGRVGHLGDLTCTCMDCKPGEIGIGTLQCDGTSIDITTCDNDPYAENGCCASTGSPVDGNNDGTFDSFTCDPTCEATTTTTTATTG